MEEVIMSLERWSYLFWIGIAIAIGIGSLRLGLGELHNPGPGFLSFISAAILGGLGIILFVTSRPPETESAEKKPLFVKGRIMKVIATVIVLMCYAVAMDHLGFLISTMAFLFILLKVIEPQRWSIAVGGSLLASVVCYLFFDVWLKMQVPEGKLEEVVLKVWQIIM
jgi:putative tricarboxylic transport membrane protein